VANISFAWTTHPLAPVAARSGPSTSRCVSSATWWSKYSAMSCTPGVNAATRSLARRSISVVPPARNVNTSLVYHATYAHAPLRIATHPGQLSYGWSQKNG
jgi:hypothetical protein